MLGKKQIPLIYLLLTAATIIAFWQVSQCDFITYDDPLYVTKNTHIMNGVTVDSVRWAFTSVYFNLWLPLTMISHMVDVQLFGLNPHGHHMISLLFHIANTLLLFFVFHRMTKAPWKSAFVAALFAIHPLHVDSVAWVSERKDVLSTFFWMLTMTAYVSYGERPRLKTYMAALAFFIMGLMAKPMLVTLPFVMVLLDYWPLQRFGQKKVAPDVRAELDESIFANKQKGEKPPLQNIGKDTRPAVHKYGWAGVRSLLIEKIPFFALIPLFSVLTYIGAGEAVKHYPMKVRISNAFVSYFIYIGKMIWPANLALFYPHPGLWPLWQAAGAALLLGAVTAIVIMTAKRFQYLALGWLWFVGTLVPVTGIVPIGGHGRADRYTYVPLIGLFIMIAWGIPELLKKWRYCKETLFASSALILPFLLIVTWTQVGYWRNSITLYDHALKVTSPSNIILCSRGLAHDELGNHRQAISDFDRAIEISPEYADAYNYRGTAYGKLGNLSQAIADYDRAVEINPEYAEAYNNRGAVYGILRNNTQAISDYDRAIGIDPEFALAYINRGTAYRELGNHKQAISDFDRAIEINPKYARVYYNRGIAYDILGNNRQAIADFDRAIVIDPEYADAYNNRGVAYGKLGNPKQAISDFDRAIKIDHGYAKAYYNRGVVYGILRNERQAIEDLQKAARLDSEDAKNYLRSHGVNW